MDCTPFLCGCIRSWSPVYAAGRCLPEACPIRRKVVVQAVHGPAPGGIGNCPWFPRRGRKDHVDERVWLIRLQKRQVVFRKRVQVDWLGILVAHLLGHELQKLIAAHDMSPRIWYFH